MKLVSRLNQTGLLKDGIWAVMDQGIQSAANFAISIALARVLAPADYGAYSLAYTAVLLLASLQNAFIIEPFSVFGVGKNRANARQYTGYQIRWQLLVAIVLAVCGVVFGSYAVTGPLSANLAGAMLFGPVVLLSWFFKRIYYVESQPARAAWASFVQAAATGAALLYGITFLPTTGFLAFAGLGVGAAVAVLLAWHQCAPQVSCQLRLLPAEREVLGQHWEYGRWVALTGVVYWIAGYGYTSLAGLYLGIAEIGGMRAMQNIIAPVGVVMTALNYLFLPALARNYHKVGLQELVKAVRQITVMVVGGTAAVMLVLLLVASWLERLFYQGIYHDYIWLLPFIMLAQVITTATTGAGLGLRITQATKGVFYAYAVTAAFTVSFGFPVVYYWGLPGVAVGTVLNAAVLTTMTVIQWKRAVRRVTALRGEEDQPVVELA